jgi:hypothetical protein
VDHIRGQAPDEDAAVPWYGYQVATVVAEPQPSHQLTVTYSRKIKISYWYRDSADCRNSSKVDPAPEEVMPQHLFRAGAKISVMAHKKNLMRVYDHKYSKY